MTRHEWPIVLLSLKVALCSTLALLVPATACAWLLAKHRFPGKIILECLINLPLVMPPIVTGYVLLILLGRRGVFGAWLYDSFGIRLAFTWGGAAIASMAVAAPLMIRSIRLAIELVSTELEEASRTLGVGPWRTFWRITLPLSIPGMVAGSVLAFARSLGEFGATIVFAGNIAGETQTLPLAVYSALQVPGGESETVRLVALAAALSIGALIASEIINRKIARRWREAT